MLIDNAIVAQSSPISAKLGAGGGVNAAQINTTAKDFESMFISQMVENMFGDSSGDSAFGTGDTNDIYKGMMVQEYGKIIAKAGGIGIASQISSGVSRELLKHQELLHQGG
jgi:Rod binding domain-containing protein